MADETPASVPEGYRSVRSEHAGAVTLGLMLEDGVLARTIEIRWPMVVGKVLRGRRDDAQSLCPGVSEAASVYGGVPAGADAQVAPRVSPIAGNPSAGSALLPRSTLKARRAAR